MNNKPIILVSPESNVPEAQCDCACADISLESNSFSDMSFSDFIASKNSYIINPNILIGEKHANYYPLYGKGVKFSVLNDSALKLLNKVPNQENPNHYSYSDWESIRLLFKTRSLIISESPADNISIKELSIWLHITDRCNLRCEYCYLPHKKQDMDFLIGKQSIDISIKSALKHKIKKLKIKFAGGEAMILFPLILKLAKYANKQTKKFGLDLDSVILSNGTLFTIVNLKAIKDNNIRLMISLDGIEDYNDQRSTINGLSSFSKVEHSLDLVQTMDIPLDVSITISGKSVAGLPDLTKYLLERKVNFSFNFYRENNYSSSYEELQFEEKQIIKGVLSAFKIIEKNLPETSLLSSLLDRGNLSAAHTKTCGVGQNYMVFDYKGDISKCQMKMSHKVTSIHSVDPLLDIREDKIGIQNFHVENKENCNTCEWKHWCTGGCPLTTYRATGRYDLNSPNCNIYKAIYPEVIKLEMLRLLHHHNVNMSAN